LERKPAGYIKFLRLLEHFHGAPLSIKVQYDILYTATVSFHRASDTIFMQYKIRVLQKSALFFQKYCIILPYFSSAASNTAGKIFDFICLYACSPGLGTPGKDTLSESDGSASSSSSRFLHMPLAVGTRQQAHQARAAIASIALPPRWNSCLANRDRAPFILLSPVWIYFDQCFPYTWHKNY
jgi:hypothetical protein